MQHDATLHAEEARRHAEADEKLRRKVLEAQQQAMDVSLTIFRSFGPVAANYSLGRSFICLVKTSSRCLSFTRCDVHTRAVMSHGSAIDS